MCLLHKCNEGLGTLFHNVILVQDVVRTILVYGGDRAGTVLLQTLTWMEMEMVETGHRIYSRLTQLASRDVTGGAAEEVADQRLRPV